MELISFQVLWFVVAGFVLGFATSTLWEWFYYRSKRRAQLEQASSALSHPLRTIRRSGSSDEPVDESRDDADKQRQPEGWTLSYRSPGIYLENEQAPPVGRPETPAEPREDEDEPVTPRADLNAPRINPATLATLQTAVAQSALTRSPDTHSPSAHTKIYDAPLITTPVTPPAVSHRLGPAVQQEKLRTDAAIPPPLPIASLKSERVQAAPAAEARETAAEGQLAAPVTGSTAPTSNDSLDHPDDLALIKGVGEAYKRRLYGAGIYTWRQVAESDTESLRRITRAKPNAHITGWRQQARELAEKYERWNTTFQGPLDDFTRIDGIGAITADILYKAGLCTYEQLAAALPDELAKIVPAPTVGDEIDFDGWINAAVRLANTKRRTYGLHS